MTVSIHQPHFLPWFGYANKVLNSDIFVWLHQVKYRKNYFQNRTKIKDPYLDREFWLTLPVHATIESSIDTVTISDKKWLSRVERTLIQYYKRAPYFQEYFGRLMQSLNVPSELLDDVNYSSFLFLLRELRYSGRVVRFEELNVKEEDPNLRLIKACQTLGSDHYIAGKGGRNYLDERQWEREGIQVSWQVMDSAIMHYSQLGPSFIPSLSVVDALFNIGADRTREIILNSWTV